MRTLYRVANPAFIEPVLDLGVTEAFFTSKDVASEEFDGLYLVVDGGTPKARVAELARRARNIWKPEEGDVLAILEKDDAGTREVWSSGLSARLKRLGMSLATEWGMRPEEIADL